MLLGNHWQYCVFGGDYRAAMVGSVVTLIASALLDDIVDNNNKAAWNVAGFVSPPVCGLNSTGLAVQRAAKRCFQRCVR